MEKSKLGTEWNMTWLAGHAALLTIFDGDMAS